MKTHHCKRESRVSILALAMAMVLAEGCGTTQAPEAGGKKAESQSKRAITPPPRLESRFAGPPEPYTPAPQPPLAQPAAALSDLEAAARQRASTNLYAFSAKDLEIKEALALFARSHGLNIVPDPDVTGTITVDFRDLSLEKSMEAILDTFGYFAEIDRGLVRVKSSTTRFFTLDYLRLIRGGNGNSTANVSSGSSGGPGGGGVGGGGGGNGGVGGAGSSGQDGASVSINQSDAIKFWDELESQLTGLISASGKVAINRMAGQIMVTDTKASVDRVAFFLEAIKKTLHRQVDIEARIYEVVLDDEFHLGIDWQNVSWEIQDWLLSTGGGTIPFTSRWIVDNPIGGYTPKPPTVALSLTKGSEQVVLHALQEQGNLQVVSQPRIRTMNNQPALIKVGSDKPFFRQSSIIITGTGPSQVTTDTEIQMITLGTILSLTPQISEDGFITMDISPVITRLVDTVQGPDGSTAPEVDIKQTSSLVRLRSNETVVIGGLIATEKAKTVRKVPFLADVPLIGKLFQGVFKKDRKIELVIFVTPTIVE